VEDYKYKTVCILGRQPQLGLAELERLYEAEHIQPIDGAALLDIPAEDINFTNLGGSVKIARILTVIPSKNWLELLKYLKDNIPGHLQYLPDGKFTLGLSVYGVDVRLEQINKGMLELKKVIKATGRPVRIVPNKQLHLNSAQVLHNRLTHKGSWELNFVADKDSVILAQTLFVQDIEAYAARDQARPKRDARVGMLPPKLAQIMVNLAVGTVNPDLKAKVSVLDPFCGTGVILQEALLMGYNVIGTDLDQRMVKYTEENLLWLISKNPSIQGRVVLDEGDATSFKWPPFSFVASEAYLGRPLGRLPERAELKQIINDTNTVIKKALINLASQLKPDRVVCLAVPAWRDNAGRLTRLPLIDHLTDMGYTQLDLKHVPASDLTYFRENQVVARQLLLVKKV
jgi:tRNA G10  N-methylase Trm11